MTTSAVIMKDNYYDDFSGKRYLMRLSTKGSYATRAMLDLALHDNHGPVALKDIARRQQISERYLGHLMDALRVAGLVKSARGARGGFALAKLPHEIHLIDIVWIAEGGIDIVKCVDDPDACSRVASCAARDVWVRVKQAIYDVLQSITLQELMERQQKKSNLEAEIYYI